MTTGSEQVRHREPSPLERPRQLIIGCAPMRSSVNLSQIARLAGTSAVEALIVCGPTKLDPTVSRAAEEVLEVRRHRTIEEPARRLQAEGYQVVAVEQATGSVPITEHRFVRRTLLLLGNERHGLSQECLDIADVVVEIPVYGTPPSFNVAMSAAVATYEYCRQFPTG